MFRSMDADEFEFYLQLTFYILSTPYLLSANKTLSTNFFSLHTNIKF